MIDNLFNDACWRLHIMHGKIVEHLNLILSLDTYFESSDSIYLSLQGINSNWLIL